MAGAPGVTQGDPHAQVAAREPGHIAIAYYGSTSDPAKLSGYLTESRDATAAGPLFQSAAVNDPATPLYFPTESGTSPRNDYLGVAIGPDGVPWAAFVKLKSTTGDAEGYIQSTGFAGRLSAPAEEGENRMMLRRILLLVCAVAALALPGALGHGVAHADTTCPWMDTSLSAAQRAQMLLAAMSLDDKILLVHGGGPGVGVGDVAGNPALCIPALHLNDGPEGAGNGNTGVTAFPAPIGMASTWDRGLVRQAGAVNGLEHFQKGANVWLGPGLNIGRVPLNGRNFEYFSEDPYLAGQMTVAEVRGAQEDNPGSPVVATAKHYALNQQEQGRNSYSMDADPRTITRSTCPGSRPASGRSRRRGDVRLQPDRQVYACEQPDIPEHVPEERVRLRRLDHVGLGRDPFHGCLGEQRPRHGDAGLDVLGATLKTAVQNGDVPQSRLDDMVLRITRTMFRLGLFDHVPPATPVADVSTPEHHALVRKLSADGSVLLKNDGALPLTGTGKTIAVIGQTASTTAAGTNARNVCTGGGSAAVNCAALVSPLQGDPGPGGDGR